MLLQGRVKGDRIGWLRVSQSQSQSVISGCNQVDLVEGFGFEFGLLDKWVYASWVESGRVGIGAIGSGGKQNQRPKQDGFELWRKEGSIWSLYELSYTSCVYMDQVVSLFFMN